MKTKRKKLGQIYTGKEIAEFMTQLTILQDTADGEKKRFLDPAVGLGAFANLAGKN
ncbi:MAG: SAM-dependent DNA methyltransferase, partial [Lachnospiraceae bacterium]|nr:SAM-dependent DNA methyltransferase [Lachnospiraceae bacterium]